MTKKLAAITSAITYAFTAVAASAASPSGLVAPAGVVSADTDPTTVIQLVVNLLFSAAGSLAVIYLMYGGIKWITSRGDKVGVESARKHIVAAVIGLIIVAGSFFALTTVFRILGVSSNPLNGVIPSLAPAASP